MEISVDWICFPNLHRTDVVFGFLRGDQLSQIVDGRFTKQEIAIVGGLASQGGGFGRIDENGQSRLKLLENPKRWVL